MQSTSSSILQVLNEGSLEEQKALFAFDRGNSNDSVIFKFNLWSRYFFPQYFSSRDAEFHKKIDLYNVMVYRGELDAFLNIAFRGAAKTARTKLFLAFCVANDIEHSRRYIKVLSADLDNSKQIVTDIYNALNAPRVSQLYAEVFQKTSSKREETMSAFTTTTGIKILADSVNTDQRGALQEDARPDLILFEDFETRKTLRSGRTTNAIWDNMEEARTSLAKGGSCIYNCNYLSESGNVHKLVKKTGERRVQLIVPIVSNGVLAWPDRFTEADIEQMRKDDDDFEGERLCKPSASKDVMFDRDLLDRMPVLQPVREVGGFKIFKPYNPSHRYASGHDVAFGVGLDSSTSVFIDFEVNPAQVAATYRNNTIKPDDFGDEIQRESDMYGGCLAAPEKNNPGGTTIFRARQLGVKLYTTKRSDTRIDGGSPTEYGWDTNSLTKGKMLMALKKAIEEGLLELNDPDLIAECKSYSRNDLLDSQNDPRLTTRHFDLLIAAAIAWQMKDFAESKKAVSQNDEEMERMILKNRNNPSIVR